MPPVEVFFGIGSNLQREQHLCAALDELSQLCGQLHCSPVFESQPVGGQKLPFLNIVVSATCSLSLSDLHNQLKQIEMRYGRRVEGQQAVPLDIDILLYGNAVGTFENIELPRVDLIKYAFVMWPMALLFPQGIHPVEHKNYAQLWAEYLGQAQLWPVPFVWQGQALTPEALLVK
ncbi:2-amino-4-hydroxy-6-hydroxymethyldihydropteridine diphosphokinase [Pseudomonas sp. F1_0610]|uniref:2-amino-4-hydroxy-6- hydroxymethyldihydropteridine diphosphokinase n=1 Tax=Pseudomonas sp. F1_0610 TaxID=3114284 RepID=UPI0039C151D2